MLDCVWWLFRGKEEVLAEGRRVHEHIRDLVHFLEVAAHGLLLRLIGVGHFDELTIHLLIVIIKILSLVLPSHLLDLLPDALPQLRLQLLALLSIDGLMLQHDVRVCVNRDPLECMLPKLRL